MSFDIGTLPIRKVGIGSAVHERTPGPHTLAYYPLEENANDYSGNQRHGENSGVTFSGGLAYFNGGASIVLGTGDWTNIKPNMTISAWFCWNGNVTSSGDNMVVSKGEGAMRNYDCGYYWMGIKSNDNNAIVGGFNNNSDYNMHPMAWRSSGGGSPTIGPTAQPNRRYHLVITNDGTTKKAYLNGVLYATEEANTTTTTRGISTMIGSCVYYNTDGHFNGNIAKVIFEDQTWSLEDIRKYFNETKVRFGYSNYIPNEHTLVYYPFHTDLRDFVGNGNTGTINGTVTFSVKEGVEVNGSSGYCTGMSNGIANRNTYTQLFRATYTGFIDNYGLLLGDSSNYNTNSAFAFELGGNNSDRFRYYNFIGSGDVMGSNVPDMVYDLSWHLRGIVADNGTYKLYKDGVKIADGANTGTINDKPNMNIGYSSYYTTSREAKGKVRDYIVEDSAWSDSKMLQYFQESNFSYRLNPNTIAYYLLNGNAKDLSSNQYDMLNQGVTFNDIGGMLAAYFNGGNNQTYLYNDNVLKLPQGTNVRTIGFWLYDTKGDVSGENIAFWYGNGASNQMVSFGQYNGSVGPRLSQYGQLSNVNTGRVYNAWVNYIITYNGSKFSVYKNGELFWEWSYSIATSGTKLRLGGGTTWGSNNYYKGYMRNFFVEDRLWSSNEAKAYFNTVKTSFGIL